MLIIIVIVNMDCKSKNTGPVKKVYLGVLFWCTSEKGVLILTLNGEKGVLFFL